MEKDCKTLTNNELALYKLSLQNEFEAVKGKIALLEDELDKLDRAYNKVLKEEKARRAEF